ncbi:hypothetical protein JHK85_010875 [Glycine max]|nr:hypothetical protein JHK85_010875 [Glycine max]
MDPPLISDSTFSPAYSLAEIWPGMPHFPDHSHLTATAPTKGKDSTAADEVLSSTTTANLSNNDSGSNKRMKVGGSSFENDGFKAEAEASSVGGNKSSEQSNKPCEAPKPDYIHARREKISERMKILQDLVPGCNKVIGKALVLDEIINYIQSLQRQVEFLSMKLEAVNSRMNTNPTIDGFPSKDVGTQPFDIAGMVFGSQAARGYAQGSSHPGWLHMQIGGGFETT